MNLSLQLLTLFLLSAAGGPAHLPKPNFVHKPIGSQKGDIEKDANHGNEKYEDANHGGANHEDGNHRDAVGNITTALVPTGKGDASINLADGNVVSSNETALCVYPCKSSDTRIRKKRFVVTLQGFSLTLSLVNVACNLIKASRNTWGDFDIRRSLIKQLTVEIKTYEEELTEIVKRIGPKKAVIQKKENNIKEAFKVFDFSRIAADNVARNYKRFKMGIKTYQDMKGIKNLTETLQNITHKILTLKEADQPIPDKDLTDYNGVLGQTVQEDLAFEVGSIGLMDSVDFTIDLVLDQFASVAVDVFQGALDVVQIGYKIYRILECIMDQINMSKNLNELHRNTLNHRNNLKQMYDKAKIALRDLDRIEKQLEVAESMFNEQIDKLVVFTNTFFEKLGTSCRSSPGTLETDISELGDLVKHQKDDFDLKVTIELERENVNTDYAHILSYYPDEMKAFLPADHFDKYLQEKSKQILKRLRLTNANVELDDLINKMTKFGFLFPNEQWSKWTPIQSNLTCSCKDQGQNTTCLVEETRSCLGQCVGPTERVTDKCEIRLEDKLHFYKKCKSRDASLRGKCIMANTNKTRDNGEVLGRYVNTGISQKVCYEDCKKIGGAHGCEFRKTNCFVNNCKGDCFVINEEIDQGDNFVMATCYKFKNVKGKTESLVLRRLLDSVQKAMTGDLQYNNNDFNDLVWAMLKLDKNLLQSQENGWKQILEYQQSRNDSWGGNPSSYQERNITTLILSGIPPHNSNTSLVVSEPCNFASNLGYYHLMSSVTSLSYMNKQQPTTMKALGQATAGLALSSSFFHGSHTRLGQNLDNLMIKIIIYILHQSYMEILDIPFESVPVLTQLTEARHRRMSGIELAQFMTDMFENIPSSEWSDEIENLDIPDYEVSGSALILTLITNLGHTGYKVELGCKAMMSALNVTENDKDFLMNQFLPEITAQLDKKDMTWIQKPDLRNTVTTLLRMSFSFPYQETFNSLPIKLFKFLIKQIYGEKSFKGFNDKLTDRSTLPLIEPLKRSPRSVTIEEFPGKNWCFNSQPHSKWHLQSAKGILDLFQLMDEIIGKQKDWRKFDKKDPIPETPEIDAEP